MSRFLYCSFWIIQNTRICIIHVASLRIKVAYIRLISIPSNCDEALNRNKKYKSVSKVFAL